MTRRDSEFYIGYLPKAPPGLAAWLRGHIIALLVLAALIGLVLAKSQAPFASAAFEFGTYRPFEGVLELIPYPVLRLDRPGRTESAAAYSRYYLVDFGKHGAQESARGLDGKRVRLLGQLIYRESQTMLELKPGSLAEVADATSSRPSSRPRVLGEMTLVGEIVDSKCFLGVMKPGNLKTHKSCAIRCIAGGIPPVLVVRSPQFWDQATYLLLVSADGKAVNREVLSLVAEPVEITGTVVRQDDLLILRADPATYKRL